MGNVLSPAVERPVQLAEVTAATRAYFWLTMLAAFVLRAAVIWGAKDKEVYFPDEHEYVELARSLAQHNEYAYKGHLTSFRPPLFPFFVSLAFRAMDAVSPVPARVLQMLFSLATVWVMYCLGRDGWGERVGLIAAATFAFYPTLIGYTNMLLTETTCIFFVSVTCWAMQRYLQKLDWRWAAAAGVSLGLSALVRDTLFYAGPVTIVFLIVHHWRDRLYRFKHIAVFAAGFVLAILPWAWRNTNLHGQPTLISSVGGVTFYMCNNEKAPLIHSDSIFFEKQIGQDDRYYYETLLPELNGLSETEKHETATRMAFAYMLAHPGTTFLRMLVRLVDFWGQERLVVNQVLAKFYGDIPMSGVALIIAVVFGFYSLIIVNTCFGYFFTKLRAFDVFGLFFIGYYTAMHLLVFAHSRYHMPLLPIIVILAARGFAVYPEIRLNRKTWRFKAALGAVGVFIIIWVIGLFVFDKEYVEMFMQRIG